MVYALNSLLRSRNDGLFYQSTFNGYAAPATKAKNLNMTKVASPDRTRKGQQTRERIKKGFHRALEHKNHRSITIEDICRESEIAVGGFYFHFKSQELLLQEVITEYFEDLSKQLESTISGRNVSESIEQAVEVFLKYYQERRGLTRCIQQLIRGGTETAHQWQEATTPTVRMLAKNIYNEGRHRSQEEALFLATSIIKLTTSALNIHYFFRKKEKSSGGLTSNEVMDLIINMCYRVVNIEAFQEDISILPQP